MKTDHGYIESILENDWYKTASMDEMRAALLGLLQDECEAIRYDIATRMAEKAQGYSRTKAQIGKA